MPIQPKPGDEAVPPTIDLSEDVFTDEPAAEVAADEVAAEPEAVEVEVEVAEPEAEVEIEIEPAAEVEPEPEPVAVAEDAAPAESSEPASD
jgi:hypothetical protein